MPHTPERPARQRAAVLVRVLVAAAFLIAANQFLATRFGEQSAWKGGGFGMYTDPHPQNRKVWLVLEAGGAEHAVALWPVTEALAANAAAPEAARLQQAVDLAYELSTSVDPARAARLAGLGGRLGWRLGPDGTPVLHGDGAPLAVTGARVEVNELRYDIARGRIIAERIDARAL